MLIPTNVYVVPIGNTNIVATVPDNIIKDTENTYPHNHQNFEMHFILKGNYIFKTDHNEFLVKEDSLIIIAPKDIHSIFPSNDVERYCISFAINKNSSDDCNDTYQKFFSVIEKMKNSIKIEKSFSNIVSQILENVKHHDLFHSSIVKNLLSILVLEIANIILNNKISDSQYNDNISEEQYRQLIIEQYIDTNHNKPDANLTDLASLLNLSTRQASRIIEQIWGKSFKKLLLEHRMRKAEEMIHSKKYKMSEIAKSVGYNSYEIFHRAYSNYQKGL